MTFSDYSLKIFTESQIFCHFFFVCGCSVIVLLPFPLFLLLVPSPTPQSIPPPLFIYSCSLTYPFLFFPPLSTSPSLLVTVGLIFISMSWDIFCSFVSFVDQLPLIDKIIWYLSFTTWLIHLEKHFLFLSMLFQRVRVPSFFLLQRVGVPSFFLLHSIPLYKCTTVFCSTHLLMGTQAVSSTW